jgi:uncharacterized protein
MSAALPERVDAQRMAQMRRVFEGEVDLSRMPRLAQSLASTQGSVRYVLAFDRQSSGLVTVDLHAETQLPLVCQRTLDGFEFPVVLDQRFGVIAAETGEAGLPADHEPLLSEDGMLDPVAVIEDELILALPLVPTKPGSEPVVAEPDGTEPETVREESPFAALRDLKRS